MEKIILNSQNCKSYTDEEFEKRFKLEKAKRRLHEIEKQIEAERKKIDPTLTFEQQFKSIPHKNIEMLSFQLEDLKEYIREESN